ncbi:MAG: tyrosine-type recombinase/integrase [Tissierellia bacterium]|nr:tyrosine-type recombinase/integrase [Tissierellia bacterium]
MSIHSLKQIKKTPSILSEKEINELMELPDKNTFKGSRDSAILELMYSSGMRVTELINVKLNDVNINAGIIKIEGSNERIVPLSNITKDSITNYINNFRKNKCRDINNYLFINNYGDQISRQGIWKVLKYYEKKINLSSELSPQILRNSFAVHLLKHGADIGTVQELMGHTTITATQSYLQNVDFKSLEVFKKTFPRT